MSGWVIITAYAIVRHQLMDIEVIIRRVAVFAGLFTFVFAAFISVAFLIGQIFGGGRLLSFAITSLIIIFTLKPLENFLVRLTDKFLFQKRYSYRELLKTFSDEVLTVLDLSKLVKITVDKLSQIIRPENVALLLYNKDKDIYSVTSSLNIKDANTTFTRQSHSIAFMHKTHHYIVNDKNIKAQQSEDTVKGEMKKLESELLLPLIIHEDLLGVLSLGRKKSGEDYVQDDLDILLPLARSLAVAISNAKLFDELGVTQAVAAQKDKMATIGTLAAGINHEVCNPLGIVRGQCETYLLNMEDGLYKDKTKDELLDEATRIMKLAIKETDRATAITKRLSQYAKPSKGDMGEEVNIKEEIEEVLALLRPQMNVEKVGVVKEIQPDFPILIGNRKDFQEVLFNLIRNGAQAIADTGKVTIRAHAADGMAIVEIEDTGSGIPEGSLAQLFNPFYTTKEPGKGTGLGLFITRQLVESNRGRISVRSKPGSGTTFTLEFPVK